MHRTNLLLHGINAALLWCILAWSTGRIALASLPALLFAIHPIHVESVAWVTERKDVLSVFFILGSILLYLAYLRRNRWPWLVLALLCHALGLLAKPMAVTLPLLLLVLDWWPLGRGRPVKAGCRPALVDKIPFLLLSVTAGLVTLRALRVQAMASLDDLSPWERLTAALAGLAGYLGNLVWPAGLAAMYLKLPRASAMVGGLLLVSLSAAAIATRHRWPSFAAGWAWFLLAIAPVSGLIQSGFQSRADRFAYLPFMGLYFGLVFGFAAVVAGSASEAASPGAPNARTPTLIPHPACFRRAPRYLREQASFLLVVISLAGLILLGLAAREQVMFWRDSKSLFGRILSLDPGNWIAHENLGVDQVRRGLLYEAIPHLQAAVSAKPRLPMARTSLGYALEKVGRLPEAAEQYQRAVELVPFLADPRLRLGIILSELGDYHGAAAHFEVLVKMLPGQAPAWYNLGLVLQQQGKRDEAVRAFERAAALDPSWDSPRRRLTILGGKG